MSTDSLDHLDPQQLRALAERLMGEVAARDEKLITLDAQLVVRDAQMAARDDQLATRDEQLVTRDAQIAAYDAQIAKRDQVLHVKQTHIDQLTQELALYKRWRYGKRSAAGSARLHYESDPVSTLERARSVCLLEGGAYAIVNTEKSPDRRAAAASFDASRLAEPVKGLFGRRVR